jgi:echinoid protein
MKWNNLNFICVLSSILQNPKKYCNLVFFIHRIDFRPKRGIYDLTISNVSYSRDNGRFECRIKAVGTGADVHQEYYNLTVLTPPQPPLIAPGKIVVATEDKKQELTCSSVGGSPDPTIM